ncbi:sensor histidine kinase [Acidocella sp.]|uniref:sensor histidine kinase n=1 Tax=Acidocella sp. TaxID=50710 RepID=UPI002609EF63|nr:PAS domain-containing sensor histidine kinase [Acidocella sp.]
MGQDKVPSTEKNEGEALPHGEAEAVAREARGVLQALAEREEQLRSILATVPDAMIVIDGRGVVEAFSAAAERLFGWSAAEMVGRNVSALMPEPYASQHDGYLGRYHATGQTRVVGMSRVVLGQRRDGTTFPMELHIGETVSHGRRAFTGFVRDLTERQETQARLHEVQAELAHMSRFTAMGEMASTLAHELNQPLTAIATYLNGCRRLFERLEGTQSGPLALLKDGVERAGEQALRAGLIIRRLREFVTRGATEHRAEKLPKLIEEAGALALIGSSEAGVRVRFGFDAECGYVRVDKIQIQQVLVNLIRNALEAMNGEETRELSISTSPWPEEMVRVCVADTGPGIAPEVAAQLFRPFVSTKSQGMGVGLSVSRSIIEAHGGRLWAEPNPAGRGALFAFTLHAAPAPGKAAP